MDDSQKSVRVSRFALHTCRDLSYAQVSTYMHNHIDSVYVYQEWLMTDSVQSWLCAGHEPNCEPEAHTVRISIVEADACSACDVIIIYSTNVAFKIIITMEQL